MSKLNLGRYGHSMVEVEGFAYVIGGKGISSNEDVSTVERLNTKYLQTAQWEVVKLKVPEPCPWKGVDFESTTTEKGLILFEGKANEYKLEFV